MAVTEGMLGITSTLYHVRSPGEEGLLDIKSVTLSCELPREREDARYKESYHMDCPGKERMLDIKRTIIWTAQEKRGC